MYYTRTGVVGDVGCWNNPKTFVGGSSTFEVVKQRLIFNSDELFSSLSFNNGVFHLTLFSDESKTILETNVLLLSGIVLEANIGEIGIDCKG